MRLLSTNISPSPEQLTVMGDVKPGFRIIRGAAGSGKTTTALLRLRELVRVRLDRRERRGDLAPVRVLVLTFNRTLEGYIAELARQSRVLASESSLDLTISTFGRWARGRVGNVTILDQREADQLIKTQLNGVVPPDHYPFFVDEVEYILGRFLPENLANYRTVLRTGRGTTPRVDSTLRAVLLQQVLPAYQAAKSARRVVDWNDIAVRAAHIAPDLLYDVVIVDEAQDLSANQVRAVLRHLHPLHTTTFVLDAVQRIYPRHFTWLEVDVPARPENVRVLKQNYRSTGVIADLARSLVAALPREDDGVLPNSATCQGLENVRPLVVAGKYHAQFGFMINRLMKGADLTVETVGVLKPESTGGFWWFGSCVDVGSASGLGQ